MAKLINEKYENLCVVVIEDNEGDFVLIEDYLLDKFKKIEVLHFYDFTSALPFLNSNKRKISMILMDLHLPGLKGLDLINQAIGLNLQVPIIILTGYADKDLAKKSLQLGIYDYLIKDEINPIILSKTIIYALNRSSFVNQIEREKDNYQNLFNFNPQPTWLVDKDSLQIINANIAAQIKYGIKASDFKEMNFRQLHLEEDVPNLEKLVYNGISPLEKATFTHKIDKGEHNIKVNLFHQEIETDAGIQIIMQSNDITESLERISLIQRQNETLRDIAWTQSHVVRAPLSRILGIINLLEEQGGNPDDLSFWMEQLRVSTMEMDGIVKNIVGETNQLIK